MPRLNPGIIMLAIGVALLAVNWAISSSLLELVLGDGDFQLVWILSFLTLVVPISGVTLVVLGIRRAVRRTERGWTIDIF